MTVPLIQVENVRRDYDKGRIVALGGLSLSLARGESVAVVGRSGSGKSTLCNVMTGLEAPSSGRVLFAGTEVRSQREWARLRARRIGIVFQQFNLLPTLTALENVEAALFPSVSSGRDRGTEARRLLDRVGILHCADRRPPELSGGERQRVAIARAVTGGRDLLICDEPTGSLDVASSAAVMSLIDDVRMEFGTTLVMVTHDPALFMSCDRRVELADGRVVADERVRGAATSRPATMVGS